MHSIIFGLSSYSGQSGTRWPLSVQSAVVKEIPFVVSVLPNQSPGYIAKVVPGSWRGS